jgi:threonine aldolase
VAGPKDFIDKARLRRKVMGGGMRQAGILAAAGIIALRDMTGRLAEDHQNARKLQAGLAKIPGISIVDNKLDINMVFFTYSGKVPADGWTGEFKKRGILIGDTRPGAVYRFVTHEQVSSKDVDTVLETAQEIFR